MRKMQSWILKKHYGLLIAKYGDFRILKTILLTVKGNPTPQPRHQVARRTGRAYIPSEHNIHSWKEKIRLALDSCPESGQPTEGLCQLTLKFYFPIPKYCRRSDGSANAQLRPTVRKDIDNLTKAVMDVLQGPHGYYVDDSQVYKLKAEKHWVQDTVGKCEIKLVIE
mgnify:CR=1 FL=1